MTVAFGPDSDVHVSNGHAVRLLTAIGYKGSLSVCDGEMPIAEMLAGIQTAKSVVSEEDLEYLQDLEELCLALRGQGADTLYWS